MTPGYARRLARLPAHTPISRPEVHAHRAIISAAGAVQAIERWPGNAEEQDEALAELEALAAGLDEIGEVIDATMERIRSAGVELADPHRETIEKDQLLEEHKTA